MRKGAHRNAHLCAFLSSESAGGGPLVSLAQIINLLQLAPESQEAILFLPRTQKGRDPIREIMVRLIPPVLDWRKQRQMWKELLLAR